LGFRFLAGTFVILAAFIEQRLAKGMPKRVWMPGRGALSPNAVHGDGFRAFGAPGPMRADSKIWQVVPPDSSGERRWGQPKEDERRENKEEKEIRN